jgi:hypothetical protein
MTPLRGCSLCLPKQVRLSDREPVNAAERRDALLVSAADGAVVVWDGRDPNVWRVEALGSGTR